MTIAPYAVSSTLHCDRSWPGCKGPLIKAERLDILKAQAMLDGWTFSPDGWACPACQSPRLVRPDVPEPTPARLVDFDFSCALCLEQQVENARGIMRCHVLEAESLEDAARRWTRIQAERCGKLCPLTITARQGA